MTQIRQLLDMANTPGQSLSSIYYTSRIALTPSKILFLALLISIMLSEFHIFLIDYFCRHWQNLG